MLHTLDINLEVDAVAHAKLKLGQVLDEAMQVVLDDENGVLNGVSESFDHVAQVWVQHLQCSSILVLVWNIKVDHSIYSLLFWTAIVFNLTDVFLVDDDWLITRSSALCVPGADPPLKFDFERLDRLLALRVVHIKDHSRLFSWGKPALLQRDRR